MDTQAIMIEIDINGDSVMRPVTKEFPGTFRANCEFFSLCFVNQTIIRRFITNTANPLTRRFNESHGFRYHTISFL